MSRGWREDSGGGKRTCEVVRLEENVRVSSVDKLKLFIQVAIIPEVPRDCYLRAHHDHMRTVAVVMFGVVVSLLTLFTDYT